MKHKYDDVVMQLFAEVFNDLPLCATIGGKVVVMHGGLFQQDGVKLEDIKAIKRNREPPEPVQHYNTNTNSPTREPPEPVLALLGRVRPTSTRFARNTCATRSAQLWPTHTHSHTLTHTHSYSHPRES